MEIIIWWGRNDNFDSGRFKSIKGDFLVEEMSKFLAVA